MSKNSYATGVRIGNWAEDARGASLAQAAIHAHPVLGVSEATARFQDRSADFQPSRPPVSGVDAIPGRLVFAHGPNIARDTETPPDAYLSVTAAWQRGYRPHEAAGHAREQARVAGEANNRVDRIAEKARLRAAGIDEWDPAAATKLASLAVERTVRHGGLRAPAIPVTGLAPARADAYRSLAAAAAGDAAVIAAVALPAAETGHARDGTFSRSWARGCGPRAPL